jgi:7-keto-8-aminopelargonate synthetase-like enzyme
MKTKNALLKERVEFDDSLLRNNGFNPYYVSICSEQKDPLVVNGKEVINLATNNYLGLSNDERIKEAYINAIRKYGISMCATPIAGGYTELFDQTKNKLSSFIGVESVLLYPSCYQANNGVFLAIARKEDLILFDRFAHSSLIQGIRSVGCKALPFSHNDPECLEYLLQKSAGYSKVFVVTESVFSTEGSIAPFKGIYDLCLRYYAVPVVDDSHGIGVIGKNGKGILSHAGITEYDGIYTASLGKAMANNCGVIGGSVELINYLSYFSSHLIYSTALPPAIMAGIQKTIDIVLEEFEERKKRIYRYSMLIKNSLAHNGFNIANSEAPITSVIAGSSENTLCFAKKLFFNSILSTPFVYPSVRKNDGRVRLIAGANLKENSIERVTGVFENIRMNQ